MRHLGMQQQRHLHVWKALILASTDARILAYHCTSVTPSTYTSGLNAVFHPLDEHQADGTVSFIHVRSLTDFEVSRDIEVHVSKYMRSLYTVLLLEPEEFRALEWEARSSWLVSGRNGLKLLASEWNGPLD